MAKGQKRGNREIKKPKATQKPAPAAASAPSRPFPVKSAPAKGGK